jgi:lipid A disaccharide synthetase
VSPSWWAYRGGEARLSGLAAAGVDLVLCLLPFEPPPLRAAGISAEFVGHPVVEDVYEAEAAAAAAAAAAAEAGAGAAAAAAAAEGAAAGAAAAAGLEAHYGQTFRSRGGDTAPVLALLPGSRAQELDRHLPLMREMSALLAANMDTQPATPNTNSSTNKFAVPAGTRVIFPALPQHMERLKAEAATWPLPATVGWCRLTLSNLR